MNARRLGHFEILEPLGAGGMGEVYKARDLGLERLVALKVMLPVSGAADAQLKRRFGFEARAASALNHPNIVTIYEISCVDDCEFIAMELVDGRTLHQILGAGLLPLADVLRYAGQVADALGAAHAQNIVHRDLKPGNIMVTARGLVKVLDFGLAKATPAAMGADGETITAHTENGVILGTLAYMSPEQAEGRRVDGRSDIFSFGAVLYEMLTGRRAFEGQSAASTLAAILRDEPRPVAEIRPDVPGEVAQIVRDCLRKSPEDRPRSMEEVRRRLEQQKAAPAANRARLRFRGVAISAVAASVLGAAAYFYAALSRREPAARDYALTRITNDSGLTTDPALSRDGKLLAYASDRAEGNLDIWVRQVSGGDSVRLTHDAADEYEPAFSSDGTLIAFRSERDGGGIYVVPSLGGSIRMIAKKGLRPRFSPDGRWIAFWVQDPASHWGKAYVVSASGGAPRQVAADLASVRGPVWSASSDALLILAAKTPGDHRDWWIVPAAGNGGASVQVGARESLIRAGLDADGEHLIPGDWWNDRVVFAGTKGDTHNIWSVGLSARTRKLEGPPERLTEGSSADDGPVFSAGGTVAFSSGAGTIGLWTQPIDAETGAASGPMARTTGVTGYAPDDPSLSDDGASCAFSSRRGEVYEIHLFRFSTGQETVLASGSGKGDRLVTPSVSHNGSLVAFRHAAGKKTGVGVIAAAGGLAEDLCDNCGTPVGWVPGDRQILVAADGKIALLDTRTRQVRRVLESAIWKFNEADLSSDSRWIAIRGRTGGDRSVIFVAPWNDGAPAPEAQWIAVTDPADYAAVPRWSPDGSLLYYGIGQGRQIGARRLDPRSKAPLGPPLIVNAFPLARFHMTFSHISVAGGHIVFAVNETLANVWLRAPESR